jgi:hypothetical protein
VVLRRAVTEVVAFTGLPLAFVLDLPVNAFDSLHDDVMAIKAKDTIDQSWLSMIAAQGSKENMEKALAEHRKRLLTTPEGLATADAKEAVEGMLTAKDKRKLARQKARQAREQGQRGKRGG